MKVEFGLYSIRLLARPRTATGDAELGLRRINEYYDHSCVNT